MKTLLLFLLLPSVALADGDAAKNAFVAGCLHSKGLAKVKRACNSHDDGDTSCSRSSLPASAFPETRIFAANWESSMFLTWIAQIILSEVMMMPAAVETGGDANTNFYDPDNAFGYGVGYGLDTALTEASDDPTCSKPDTPCAHAQLECWSGQVKNLAAGVAAKKLEYGGANGMVGQMRWYISQKGVEKEPSLATYFGLQDKAKAAEALKKPITWGEYCEKFSPNQCTGSCATCKADIPPPQGSELKFFSSSDPATGYKGHFHNDGVGHIVNPPCGWSVLIDAQLHYNGLTESIVRDGSVDEAKGYSYGDMLQIQEAAARNQETVLYWWWTPDAVLQRHEQKDDPDAEWFRVQPVTLKMQTNECVENRPWDDKCSANATKRIGAKDGGCDFDGEALFKTFSSTFKEHNKPAHEFLSKIQLSTGDAMELLQAWRWSGLEDIWSKAPRVAVCNFVANNLDEGLKLRKFIPEGYPKQLNVNEISTGMTTILMIFGIIGIVIDAVMFGWLVKNSKSKLVKMSQPLFLKLVLAGAVMLNVLVILAGQPPSDIMCGLAPWVGHVGFFMLAMPLLCKTHRIAVLLVNNKKMKRIKLSNGKLLGFMAIPGSILIIYLCIFSGLGYLPKANVSHENMYSSSTSVVEETMACTSDSSTGWGICFVFEILQLLWGVSLCVQTRKVSGDFSEAKYIAFGIYNVTFIAVIAGVFSFGSALDPSSSAAVIGLATWAGSNMMVLLVFLPKLFKSENTIAPFSQSTASTAVTKLGEVTGPTNPSQNTGSSKNF